MCRVLVVISLLLSLVSCEKEQDKVEDGVSLELAKERKANIGGVTYKLYFSIPADRSEAIMAESTIFFELFDLVPVILDFKEAKENILAVTSSDGRKVPYTFKNEHIITNEDYNKWIKKENYNEFIKIIQTNYAVIPTSNNERTKRQSGAFLLPGMFSVIKDTQNEFQIYRSCRSLKEEFDEKFFYVNGDDKESILKELDICNINESTLFPELEHQLNYIKESNSGGFDAPYFEKYDENFLIETKKEIIQDVNPNFENEIMDYINSKISNKVISEKIKDSIISTISIDWYKKDSILSQMKNNITRLLIAVSMPMDSAKFIANDILNNAILLYKAKGE